MLWANGKQITIETQNWKLNLNEITKSDFSGQAFMHRRMEENGANVEINNPMFGEDQCLEEEAGPTDALRSSFTIEVNEKVLF